MTAAEIEREFPQDRDMFKMGAVIAIGEFFDEGLLGSRDSCAPVVREHLANFGVRSMADIDRLCLGASHTQAFEQLYA